ncbi:MAG: hypothetical protein AAFX50_10200, partial [Acidobacteriota bacterium]
GPNGIGVTLAGNRGRIKDLLAYDAGDGTKLFAVGAFDLAGGEVAYGAATWDGQRWSPLIYQQPLVRDVGVFGNLSPNPCGGRSFSSPEIDTLGGFNENGVPTLFASGFFTQIGGLVSIYLARYRDTPGIFSDGFETGDTSAWILNVP